MLKAPNCLSWPVLAMTLPRTSKNFLLLKRRGKSHSTPWRVNQTACQDAMVEWRTDSYLSGHSGWLGGGKYLADNARRRGSTSELALLAILKNLGPFLCPVPPATVPCVGCWWDRPELERWNAGVAISAAAFRFVGWRARRARRARRSALLALLGSPNLVLLVGRGT